MEEILERKYLHRENPGHKEMTKLKDNRYQWQVSFSNLGTVNIFNKIIEENFPNLKKELPMNIQVAYKTCYPSYRNQNSKCIIKKKEKKKKNIKSTKGKWSSDL